MKEEQREYEELCKNNPNYPKDFELHKMYQSHIKKWKPLIESNDPLIYSEWEWFNYVGSGTREFSAPEHVIIWLTKSTVFQEGIFSILKERRLTFRYDTEDDTRCLFRKIGESVYEDPLVRREVIMLMYESYINAIERTANSPWWQPNDKKHLIRYVDVISKGGTGSVFHSRSPDEANPFDLFYHTNYMYDRLPWRARRADGVGYLIVFGISVLLMILLYFFGPPEPKDLGP